MSHKYTKKRRKREKISNMDKTISIHNLINSTVIFDKDYREIFDDAVKFAYGEPLDEYSEKSINAIMVNDIRHNCSNYEQNLKPMHRIHRTDKDYIQYKNSVLDKISKTYTSLEDECNRQKSKLDMVIVKQR